MLFLFNTYDPFRYHIGKFLSAQVKIYLLIRSNSALLPSIMGCCAHTLLFSFAIVLILMSLLSKTEIH